MGRYWRFQSAVSHGSLRSEALYSLSSCCCALYRRGQQLTTAHFPICQPKSTLTVTTTKGSYYSVDLLRLRRTCPFASELRMSNRNEGFGRRPGPVFARIEISLDENCLSSTYYRTVRGECAARRRIMNCLPKFVHSFIHSFILSFPLLSRFSKFPILLLVSFSSAVVAAKSFLLILPSILIFIQRFFDTGGNESLSLHTAECRPRRLARRRPNGKVVWHNCQHMSCIRQAD